MDVKPLEAILAEIGKAFRLCRFYPATHPSVQQALAELSSVLPNLASVGAIELRINPTGFLLGTLPLALRNPQIQELAGLLYAQGYRGLAMEPGLTSDEIAALSRAIASSQSKSMQALGAQATLQRLPHLRLEQTVRRSASGPHGRASDARKSASTAMAEGPSLGRRSTGVFRPDALPPEIEAARLIMLLEHSAPAEAPRMLSRLQEVAGDLCANREFGTYAKAVLALGRWTQAAEEDLAGAARTALENCTSSLSTNGLVSRLGDQRASAAERDTIVQALGVLGAKAIPLVVDAYLATSHQEERDILLATVRRAGGAAVEPIEARRDRDARGETARAYAALLGATQSTLAAPALADLARHAEGAVRAVALAGLARVGGPEASRLTAHALRDHDPAVRAEAARALALIGDHSTATLVLARLTEEAEETVVLSLVATLGDLRESRAVPVLADLVRGISGVFQRHPVTVRAAAIRALGAIGTPEARAAVEAHLEDRIPELRAAAHDARQ
jgi:hypothetical protein